MICCRLPEAETLKHVRLQLLFRQDATIRFLIGGGCDDRNEYVELVVDGVGVAKATGRCAEDMRSVT